MVEGSNCKLALPMSKLWLCRHWRATPGCGSGLCALFLHHSCNYCWCTAVCDGGCSDWAPLAHLFQCVYEHLKSELSSYPTNELLVVDLVVGWSCCDYVVVHVFLVCVVLLVAVDLLVVLLIDDLVVDMLLVSLICCF